MAFTVENLVADVCTITPNVPDSSFDVEYDISNPQTEFVDFRFEYEKDADTYFMFKASTNLAEHAAFFQEIVIDYSSMETALASFKHTADGRFSIVIPVKKNASKVKINIKPDSLLGNGFVKVHISESVLRSNR